MKSLFAIGLLAAASVSTSATAGLEPGDMITVSRLGTTPSHTVRYSYDSTRSYDQPPATAGDFGIAGVTNFRIVGGPTIQTFCVEMNEGFVDDPIEYTVVELSQVPEHAPPGPMDSVRQTLMRDLYSRFYSDVMDSTGSFADRSDMACAFQMVIWEISHENLIGGTPGGVVSELDVEVGAMAFTDTGTAASLSIANQMISELGTGGFQGFASLFGLSNPSNQDMLIVVPSPAIAGLAGLGLAGMRRRRR